MMKLIQYNPYRFAGVLSNAPQKEIEKQKSKVKRLASIGRSDNSELDFPFFSSIDRADISKVNRAFSAIEQNSDKVRFSLFWFLNINSFDNTAISYLINGNRDKAIEIWEKVTKGKDVTSKNFSCFNNIGTLKLLSDHKGDIKKGIQAKVKLIESLNFVDFVNAVADQTYIIDIQKQIEKFVDEIIIQFKGKYSNLTILKFFNKSSRTIQKYLTQKFTEEPINTIEGQIETCKKNRKRNRASADEFGLNLYSITENELDILKSIFGTGDLKYKSLADQLANEILQCGIDYFNQNQTSNSTENYLKSAHKLAKIAESIAVGEVVKNRVVETLSTFEEAKSKEIDIAIVILRSIKQSYQKASHEIDLEIDKMRKKMKSNHYINQKKVADLKTNSLNWGKIVDYVLNEISKEDVELIKNTTDEAKLYEYMSLVEFLFAKLSYSELTKVIYLAYWMPSNSLERAIFLFKAIPMKVKLGALALFVIAFVYVTGGIEAVEVFFMIILFLGLLFFLDWIRFRLI